VVGFYEEGNKHSDYIKGGEFLDYERLLASQEKLYSVELHVD
jgi:hypothetical protein